jgi:hypothetical protein
MAIYSCWLEGFVITCSLFTNPCFGFYRYGGSVERMSLDEFEEGKQWLDETFHLIRYNFY